MKYSELISALYGDDIRQIENVLNKSIYAPDLDNPPSKSIVVHTGFVFFTHRHKRMELLYDFGNHAAIKQVRFDGKTIPQLNGLLVSKSDSRYYNMYHDIIFNEIVEHENNAYTFNYLNLKDPRFYCGKEINSAEVIDTDNNTEFLIESIKVVDLLKQEKNYPLQRVSFEDFYFDGETFTAFFEDEGFDEDADFEDDEVEFEDSEDRVSVEEFEEEIEIEPDHYTDADAFDDATDGQLDPGESWTSLGRD